MVVNVYPRSRIAYKVTTAQEFAATLEQMFGAGLMDDQLGDIGDLLGNLDEDDAEGGARGHRLGRERQRARQARQQDHRRCLPAGCIRHSHRALSRESQDGSALPARRLADALHLGSEQLPQRARRPHQDHVRPRYLRAPQAAGRQDQVQEVRSARHRAAGRDDPDGGRRRRHRHADPRRRRADSDGQARPLHAQSRGVQEARSRNRTASFSCAARPAPARPLRCTPCWVTSTRPTRRSGRRKTRSRSRRRACARCR